MENMDEQPLMVTIRCTAYNHESYIRQCLEGFVMQKANFRFEAIVHDDASTDGTAAIIQEYAEKYPDIIKPIFETENQYSKRALTRIMDEHTHGKYVAICEGDDYWIDPLKLQKQVDILEAYMDCSLCFHATKCVRANATNVVYNIIKKNRQTFDIHDLILGGGGFMATNSMLFKAEYIRNRPQWMANCPVGDLPLMLLLGCKGSVYYIDDIMSVYRVGTGGYTSIVGRSFSKIHKHYNAIFNMFEGFDKWSNNSYHNTIVQRKKRLKKMYFVELVMCCIKKIFGENIYFKSHVVCKKNKK